MSKGKYYFSKSLEKGLSILALFNRDTPILTQSVIAKTLGLNMTSTYRYINTLVEMGYLAKDSKTKEIQPSTNCLLLCINLMQATDNLKMVGQIVDEIHSKHNISIDVALAVNDTLVRIYHREAREALTYSLPETSRDCLHNTALGKAYLASLDDDELKEKIDGLVLEAKTAKTIVDKEKLFEEIQLAKKDRYAIQVEEYLAGVLAIAAPLYDPISGSGVGAVSFDFSVLEESRESMQKRYGTLILATGERLSQMLPSTNRLKL